MGTTLTKPVLLDETGQEIVDKLDEIKLAIGSTGEFIPVMIKVTTPPTKTSYLAGETLDLTGMVVTLFASNGLTFDVTGDCTFSPANGATLTSQDTSVAVSYTWYETQTTFTASQPLQSKSLVSIAVTTPPDNVNYLVGDTLDLTGLVVTATYDDDSTGNVTSGCTYNPANGATLAKLNTTINISYTLGEITKTATQAITVSDPIFGVEWDGTASTAWTRLGASANYEDPNPYYAGMTTTPSSPFDRVSPWKDIEVVEDQEAGTLVKIPKFYFKWTLVDSKVKLEISSVSQPGFYISPAHCDRGDGAGERDYIYIGRYKCSAIDYKSRSGDMPCSSGYIGNYRSAISNLGPTIWQQDFMTRWTILMLYLVEYADWNSQAKIGYGNGDSTGFANVGYTDNMPYHTGTMMSARDIHGFGTQYRHIEGLWDNICEFLDGAVNQYGVFITLNPAEFTTTTSTNQINAGTGTMNSSGTIRTWQQSTVSGVEFVLLPTDNRGSSREYSYDIISYGDGNNNYRVFYAKTGYHGSTPSGIFSIGSVMNSIQNNVSSRVMKLP